MVKLSKKQTKKHIFLVFGSFAIVLMFDQGNFCMRVE